MLPDLKADPIDRFNLAKTEMKIIYFQEREIGCAHIFHLQGTSFLGFGNPGIPHALGYKKEPI
jgi:hypothetical protein